jgi:hypothetical protein
MPPERKWYYYGLFCKCGAFLPLWEAPKIADKPIILEKREDAFVEIICEVATRASLSIRKQFFSLLSPRVPRFGFVPQEVEVIRFR